MRNRNWLIPVAVLVALLFCPASASAQTKDDKSLKPKGKLLRRRADDTKQGQANPGSSNGGTSKVTPTKSAKTPDDLDDYFFYALEAISGPPARSKGPAAKLDAANDDAYLTIDLRLSPFSLTPASVVNQLLSIGLHNLAASSPGPPRVALQSSPAWSMADVTGDGTLAFAEAGDNYLQIYTLNSTLSGETVQTFLAGDTILGIAFADFNGDGKPDLAATYLNNNTSIGGIAILLNNGNGGFGSPVTYGSEEGNFTVLDVNHDGNLDIVAAGAEVWLGNGHGGFTLAGTYHGPTNANVIAAADFDGDGIPDLAVGASIGILIGNGDGTFHPGHALPAAASTYNISMLAAGDVNGDGKIDLVYSDVVNAVAGVLLGNGDGTFQTGPVYALPTQPESVVLADINGDGNLDLVNATGDARVFGPDGGFTALMLGNGDGSFQGSLTYLPPTGQSFETYLGLSVSKFGAGTPGVLTPGPSGAVLYYQGDGQGGLQPPVSVAIRGQAGFIAAGDFNGDRMPDAAIIDSGAGPGGISILQATSSGFEPSASVASGVPYPAGIVAADFDGDGKQDLVVVGASSANVTPPGTLAFLKGNGNGTFQSPATMPGGISPRYPVAVDVNGDHLLDLVFSDYGNYGANSGVYVALNQGGGKFSAPVNVYPGALSAFGVADVDGDNIPDLVVSGGSDGANYLSWMKGNGNGTFQPAIVIDNTLYAPATYMLVQDFLGNGKTDILLAQQFCCTAFFVGHGDGTFALAPPIITTQQATLLASADLNGDGQPDVVVLGTGLSTLLNDYAPNACDVNPDGTPDIADVQTMVNEALGAARPLNDLNNDGVVNVVDLQIVLNAALGLNCSHSQPISSGNANANPAGERRL